MDVLVHGVVLLQLQDFALLIQLRGAPVGLFFQPVELPWDGSMVLWPLLSVLCHLQTGWVYTLHHHLMNVVNRIKPIIDPWATLPVTASQLDFIPLITTLWAWPFTQFLVHLPVCSSSLYFSSFPVRILWQTVLESLSKALLNILCSPLFYQDSNFITEGCQAWSVFGESMLTLSFDSCLSCA